MKSIIIITGMICMINSFNGHNIYSEEERTGIRQSREEALTVIDQNDSLLFDIQKKILDAFIQSQIAQSDQELSKLEQGLTDIIRQNNNNLVIYWYAFTCYYHSIFYFVKKDMKNSEDILEEGIDKLKTLEPKSSEHLALLVMMEGFSLQFASGIKAAFISKRVNDNGNKAIELDSTNLRAFFVMGSNDFYTPEQYGGGEKAEDYLKKAIQLNDQSVQSPYLPGWGKNSAYEMLIRLYIKKQQWDEAGKYYKEAIGQYPDDYMINQLARELEK